MVRGGDDRDVLGDSPHRVRDVGVGDVAGGAGNQSGVLHPQVLPGLRVVQLSHQHVQPEVVEAQGLLQLGDHQGRLRGGDDEHGEPL